MRKLTAALVLAASLLALHTADAKPRHARRKPTAESNWMKSCIDERTGPVGGVSVREARAICKAEQPEDEVSAAKAQLALAKANARIAKARAKAAKAIEACEQAVVDACVEASSPEHPGSCEDEDLKAAFAQCH